jgi:hypothetical protein
VNVGWHNLLANPFDKIRSCFDKFAGLFVCLEDRTVWISADDLDMKDSFLLRIDQFRRSFLPCQAGDEVSNLAVSLFPNLWTGCAIVRFGDSLDLNIDRDRKSLVSQQRFGERWKRNDRAFRVLPRQE